MSAAPTIGVEEEFLLLDPETRAPIPVAERVIGRAATSLGDLVSSEFARQQLEVKTPPCADAAQLRNELLRLRVTAAAAARDEGVRLCAAGTPVIAAPGRLRNRRPSPLPGWAGPVPSHARRLLGVRAPYPHPPARP